MEAVCSEPRPVLEHRSEIAVAVQDDRNAELAEGLHLAPQGREEDAAPARRAQVQAAMPGDVVADQEALRAELVRTAGQVERIVDHSFGQLSRNSGVTQRERQEVLGSEQVRQLAEGTRQHREHEER